MYCVKNQINKQILQKLDSIISQKLHSSNIPTLAGSGEKTIKREIIFREYQSRLTSNIKKLSLESGLA